MKRRRFLSTVGIATGALAAGSLPAAAASRGQARTPLPPDDPTPPGQQVRAFLGNLRRGTRLGAWTVVAVCDTRLGAMPIVLRTPEGGPFQVDVLRRDPRGPAGIAETASLSLYVANGGGPTAESQRAGAAALASALGRREQAGATVPALLTLRERTQRFPRGAFSVVY